MSYNIQRVFGIICLALCISAQAAHLIVGDAVPAIKAKDQHGTHFILTTNIEYLLVATEMNAAKSANYKLAEQGAGFLEKHGAAYLMDIRTMPAIARLFALPKMRKNPERIVLVDEPGALAKIPVQVGEVTVLTLTPAMRVKKISYWNLGRDPIEKVFE